MTWPRAVLHERQTWVVAALMLVLGAAAGAAIFSFLAHPETGSDLLLHVGLVIDSRTADTHLGYTIYYALLELVSGGGNAEDLRRATIIVLSIAYGLRLAVTWLLFSLTGMARLLRVVGTLITGIASPLTVLTLSVVPGDYFHVGKLSPVVWHNSTTILAAPFALLLFASTCWVMQGRRPGWVGHVAQVGLVIVSGWTKPNYILALVPALAVACLILAYRAAPDTRGRLFRDLLWRAGPTAGVAAAVLLSQYLHTYGGTGLLIEGQRVSNVVAPFAVWDLWATRYGVPVMAFLYLSLIIPAMLGALVWNVRRYRYPLLLAWTSLLVGIVQFVVLAEVLEDGTVLFHGNWIWGAQLSMAVLFVVSLAAFLAEFRNLSWARWIPAGLVAYQSVLGIVWLGKLFGGMYAGE